MVPLLSCSAPYVVFLLASAARDFRNFLAGRQVCHEVDPVGTEAELHHFAWDRQVLNANAQAPKSELRECPQDPARVLRIRTNKDIQAPV
jgi:hypothetical protein